MGLFINWNGPDGKETVDEIQPDGHCTPGQLRAYARQMVEEYNMAFGGGCYLSQRPCRNWKP